MFAVMAKLSLALQSKAVTNLLLIMSMWIAMSNTISVTITTTMINTGMIPKTILVIAGNVAVFVILIHGTLPTKSDLSDLLSAKKRLSEPKSSTMPLILSKGLSIPSNFCQAHCRRNRLYQTVLRVLVTNYT